MKSLPAIFILLTTPLAMAETSPRVSQVMRVPPPAEEMAAVDADGDGDLDIVTYSSYKSVPTWYENLGNRQFADPKVIYYPNEDYAQIPADLNGDGIVDLLVQSSGTTPQGDDTLIISALILNENLQPVRRYKLFEGGGQWSVVNLDGEGPAEILQLVDKRDSIGHVSSVLKIWNLQPDGHLSSWSSPIDLPYVGEIKHAKTVDADGDGDLDLHIGHYLLERSGHQTFSDTIRDVHFDTFGSTRWADLDGDGLPELFTQESQEILYMKNEGNLSFTEIHVAADIPTIIAVNEVPGEKAIFTTADELPETDEDYPGHDETFFLQRYRFETDVTLSTRRSFFPSEAPIRWSRPKLVADFDGDGTQDVVMINELQLPPELTRNSYNNDSRWVGILWGSGNDFPEGNYITSPPLLRKATVSADYDKDGDVDIIAGPNVFDQYELLLNDGKGNFTFARYLDELLPALIKNQGGRISSLIKGDVDQDGDVDLLINYEKQDGVYSTTKFISAFVLNNGHAQFALQTLPIGALDFLSSSESCDGLYDWDGDGDLDATQGGSWRKNENGTLAASRIPLISGAEITNMFGIHQPVESCKFGDLDGDGRSDVISEVYEATTPDIFGAPSELAIGFSDEFGVLEEIVTLPIQIAGTDAMGNPTIPGSCQILDVNLDGKNDLVYSKVSGTDALGNPMLVTEWKRNPGHGSRNPATWVTLPLPFMPGIKGDFDGDGRTDYSDGRFFLTPTRSGPECSGEYDFLQNVTLGIYQALTSFDIADFDGDGDSDLLAYGNEHIALVRNLIIDERSGVAAKLRTLGVLGKTANPDEDPDGDGRDNATELLQGTDPQVVDAPQPQRALPKLQVMDGQVKVQFQNRSDAEELNLSYILETSSDLSEWTTVSLTDATSVPLTDSWKQTTVSGEKQEKAFYRVRSEHQVPAVK